MGLTHYCAGGMWYGTLLNDMKTVFRNATHGRDKGVHPRWGDDAVNSGPWHGLVLTRLRTGR